MRVLGFDIQKSDVFAVLLDGTETTAVVTPIDPAKMSLPRVGPDEADNLLLFEDQLATVVRDERPDCVALIKAVGGIYSPSPIRVKIECLVQLAAKRNGVRCVLMSPHSVTNAQNKTAKDGETLKKSIEALKPKYTQRAAYCAWNVLRDQA